MQLTVSGKGNAARHGGVNGDLLVLIEEEPDKELVRDGNDLIYNLNITFPQAVLGASVEVPTVDARAKIKIEPGTQAGKVLRLRGKGIPDVNGYGRGDILVVVNIDVPSSVSASEKGLLEQLAQTEHFKQAGTEPRYEHIRPHAQLFPLGRRVLSAEAAGRTDQGIDGERQDQSVAPTRSPTRSPRARWWAVPLRSSRS